MKNWQSEINDDLYFPMLWYELFAEWVCSSYTETIPQKLSGIISSYNYIFNSSFVFFIFRCCFKHDWCYSTTSCKFLAYNLPYFVPYKWKCNAGSPKCCMIDIHNTWNFTIKSLINVFISDHKNRGRRSCSEEQRYMCWQIIPIENC